VNTRPKRPFSGSANPSFSDKMDKTIGGITGRSGAVIARVITGKCVRVAPRSTTRTTRATSLKSRDTGAHPRCGPLSRTKRWEVVVETA